MLSTLKYAGRLTPVLAYSTRCFSNGDVPPKPPAEEPKKPQEEVKEEGEIKQGPLPKCPAPEAETGRKKSRILFTSAKWGLLAGGLLAGGYWGYKYYQEEQKKEKYRREDAIRTKLEADRIEKEKKKEIDLKGLKRVAQEDKKTSIPTTMPKVAPEPKPKAKPEEAPKPPLSLPKPTAPEENISPPLKPAPVLTIEPPIKKTNQLSEDERKTLASTLQQGLNDLSKDLSIYVKPEYFPKWTVTSNDVFSLKPFEVLETFPMSSIIVTVKEDIKRKLQPSEKIFHENINELTDEWENRMITYWTDLRDSISEYSKKMIATNDEKKQRELLLELNDVLSNLKGQYINEIKQLEENIEVAAADTEARYIADFSQEQEKRLEKTRELIQEQRDKLRNYIENILKKKAEIARVEFKNKLAVAIFLLEEHLETKKPMGRDLAILQKLGDQNELVKAVADSLASDPELKGGLAEVKEIHEEFHRSIPKAKLGAFVNKNKGFTNYCLSFMLYVLFKGYRFPADLGEYIGKDDTKLLNSIRHVDYVAQYMEQREYAKALDAIQALEVKYSDENNIKLGISERGIKEIEDNVGEADRLKERDKGTQSIQKLIIELITALSFA